MSYPAHRTTRGRHPPADVIKLPRRVVVHWARPAVEPRELPAHVCGLLQRAAADLSFAEAILQPAGGAQLHASRADGRGSEAPGSQARSGYAGRVLGAPGHRCVEFHLLGCFRVSRAGQDVASSSFGGRQARQVLQILLRDRGRLVPKDVLIEALWPDGDPANPGANLGVLVSRARHAIGEGSLILSRPGGYLYVDDDRSWVDAEAFAHQAERGRTFLASGDASAALQAYRSALALWAGDPFMEDMYAEWAQAFRRRFSLLYEEVLAGLAKASLELGQATTALHATRQLTQRAPLLEEGHVLLMKALAAGGDPVAAIGVFHAWRGRLADELGVDPSREARGLFQRILRHEPLGYTLPLPRDSTSSGSQIGADAGLAADVLDWIPDAVYVLGRDNRVVYANPAGAQIVGLLGSCLTGMTARDVFSDGWLEAYRNCASIALAAKAPGCFRTFCVPVDSWLEWTVYPGARGFLILSRDVTQLVQAGEHVRRALTAVEASRSELQGPVRGR